MSEYSAMYKDTKFTFEERVENGLFYLTASAYNNSVRYEITWNIRETENNPYVAQLLRDIQTGGVKLSKPCVYSKCAHTSLILSNYVNAKNHSGYHSYELKYVINDDVDAKLLNEKKHRDENEKLIADIASITSLYTKVLDEKGAICRERDMLKSSNNRLASENDRLRKQIKTLRAKNAKCKVKVERDDTADEEEPEEPEEECDEEY